MKENPRPPRPVYYRASVATRTPSPIRTAPVAPSTVRQTGAREDGAERRDRRRIEAEPPG